MAVQYHTHTFEIPVATDAEVAAGTISNKVVVPSNLGTAAQSDVGDFATSVQGGLADTAVQPGDIGDSAALDVGTVAGTVAAGDDSRIVGAVQNSRAVASGAGLTGGGDLSADRTIALSGASVTSLGKADSAWQPTTGDDGFGLTINSPRIYGRVRDHVSILDYATSVSARDNIKNGSTAFNTAFTDATTDAVARGIKLVTFPAGNFELSSNTALTNPGVYVRGEPGGTKLYKNGYGRMFQTLGTAPNTSSGGYALTANAAGGATSVTLSTANAANFTAGTRAILWQNLATASTSARDAEFVWITNVNTGTGVITFAAPIYFAYNTANTAKLFNVTLIEGVGYENLIIDWTDGTQTSPQRPPYNIDEVLVAWFCLKPRFVNVSTINTINASVSLHGCVDAYVTNLRGQNGKSDATDLTDAYSYGITEAGVNAGLVANGLQFERHRHAYTTGAADSTDTTMFNGGHPFYSVIANGTHRWAKAAGWDTHDAGVGITFQNLHTLGAVLAGFQIRTIKHRIINCTARDVLQFSSANGDGIFLVGGDATNLWARDVEIDGFSGYNLAGSGIRDQSPGTIARNIRVEKVQGNAISWDGGASGNGEYSDIYAKDIAKNAAIGGAYAVALGNASAQTNPRIRDMFVDDPNNNLTALVKRNNDATNKVELTNVRGLNSSQTPIPLAVGVSNTDEMMLRGGFSPAGQDIGPINTRAIASDSISIDSMIAAGCIPTPESGAADNLSTIVTANNRDGYIELWGSVGNTITLVHGTGANNLFLRGSSNVNLLQNQGIALRRRGTVWFEMWRTF